MKKSEIFKKWKNENEEGNSNHSKNWKLFNVNSADVSQFTCDVSSLETVNQTYSSRYVYLSNYWVEKIVEFNLIATFRKDRWSGNFKHKGHIQTDRKSKNYAFYVHDINKKLCYAIVDECYQLHEFEDVLQNLMMIQTAMSLNANKHFEIGKLIKITSKLNQLLTQKLAQLFAQNLIKIPTFVKILVQDFKAIQVIKRTLLSNSFFNLLQDLNIQKARLNEKRKRIAEENSNIENFKKIRVDYKKKESDIDIISMLSFEDEKESKSKTQKLEDIKLLCEFLYEIARNQGKILVDLDQQHKELMKAKEYAVVKEKCKKISKSTSAMIWCFLSFYSDERKMFKVAKDSKRL